MQRASSSLLLVLAVAAMSFLLVSPVLAEEQHAEPHTEAGDAHHGTAADASAHDAAHAHTAGDAASAASSAAPTGQVLVNERTSHHIFDGLRHALVQDVHYFFPEASPNAGRVVEFSAAPIPQLHSRAQDTACYADAHRHCPIELESKSFAHLMFCLHHHRTYLTQRYATL